MRQYHRLPNRFYKPSVNLDKLWSLVTEQHRLAYKEKTDVAPVIDVVRAVSFVLSILYR
jgi:large subunit ribosomal protein L27Ae